MYREVQQYLDTDPDPNVTDFDWVVLERRRYVWDGWKLLEELDVRNPESPAIARQYTWGLDLAGQNGVVNALEGAGTIGGLLAVAQA